MKSFTKLGRTGKGQVDRDKVKNIILGMLNMRPVVYPEKVSCEQLNT